MSEFRIQLTGGRLGNMYESATAFFLDRIDPKLHAAAYIGEHTDFFAESEFAGKYLSTCVHYAVYFTSVNQPEKAKKALDHAQLVVQSIIENQRADGYIGGLAAGKESACFSVWNQAFTMLGLIAYHDLTGDEKALKSAERIAEYNAALFMSGKADILDGINNGSQHISILLPLVRLHRFVSNPTVTLFTKYIVSMLRASDNNFFACNSIFDLRSKKGIENFVILLGILEYGDVYNDTDAIHACKKYWDELEATQIRENGNGTLFEVWTENGNSPRMLGLDVKPDENCVAVGWIEFSLALYYRTHESKYLDAVERALYNHLLGAISDDGSDFAYYQPNFGHRITVTADSMYKCCRYRGYSAVSHLTDMLFLTEDETIFPLVYTDARYEDDTVMIDEYSSYPYANEVVFKLHFKNTCHKKFVFRVPASVNGVKLILDQEEADVIPENGMITCSIDTGSYHEIKLIFDIKPEMREAEIDGIKRIGIMNGCILLAAESDGDPDSILVCKDVQIEKREDFCFNVGGVSYTDYASAGRNHNFIVWAREASSECQSG